MEVLARAFPGRSLDDLGHSTNNQLTCPSRATSVMMLTFVYRVDGNVLNSPIAPAPMGEARRRGNAQRIEVLGNPATRPVLLGQQAIDEADHVSFAESQPWN